MSFKEQQSFSNTLASGATGTTVFTPYAVVLGPKADNLTLQDVGAVGTSGQVFTSNGAGTIPTWQDASGGSAKAFEIHNAVMSVRASTEYYRTSTIVPRLADWTDNASITETKYFDGVSWDPGAAGKTYVNIKGNADFNQTAQWNAGKNLCITVGIVFSEDDGAGTSQGFGLSTANIDWDSGTAASKRIGIAIRSGTVKAVTADGTTLTEGSDLDGDFVGSTMNIWTIFVDDGADTAYFYLNGTLKSSLTTSTLLNNSGAIAFNMSVGNASGQWALTEMIFSYETP